MDDEQIETLREEYHRAGLPVPTYKIIYGRQRDRKPKDYNANPREVNREIRKNSKRQRGRSCRDCWLWAWCFRWMRKKSSNNVEEVIEMHDPYVTNDLSGEPTSTEPRRSFRQNAGRCVGRSLLKNCYYIQVATANSPLGPSPLYTATTRD